MILALPPRGFLDIAKRWRWVECGAGTGLWLRIMREEEIDVIGYDPNPRGPDVMQGDHRDLARHPDRACLIVWPPDGTEVAKWLQHYAGNTVAICGHTMGRITWPEWSPEWSQVAEWTGIEGWKGNSRLELWTKDNA